MDINEINRISPQKLSSPGKSVGKDGFERIFRQTISAISPADFQGAANPDAEIIDQSTKVLDLLDEYVNELNNPSKTLKDIDPLIKAIDKEVTRIEARRANDPGSDRALEGLVKNLTVTARVAMLKYQRGDYL